MDEERIIEHREEKLKEIFMKKKLWIIVILAVILILGVYIRVQPMLDRNGKPGLWDITTNTWTLGPDLDPFLFLRYAKDIVAHGSLMTIDTMRNVPVGFETSMETKLLPYMIAYTYKFLSIFTNTNVEYAAVIFPVILFALTIIVFFLFVRELFRKEGEKTKADIIALIATAIMIVIPAFLSRTVAGIPEKESGAFFFMFLAFYLFLRAWKSENLRNAIILAVFAGISTTLMGLVWGGVVYIYVAIGLASFAAFVLNKIHKKEFIVYSVWLLVSFVMLPLFSFKFSFRDIFTSLDTGFAFVVFIICAVHFMLWKPWNKIRLLHEIKLPKNVTSLIVSMLLILIFSVVFLGPGFIITKINAIHQMLFQPLTGRWSVTVAENKQPYFVEWASSFGPMIGNFPVLFWGAFIGSIVLFRKAFNNLKKKDAWIITGAYILLMLGLVFSRYSPTSTFNGDNFISQAFFYLSALLFALVLLYFYWTYHKNNDNSLEKIDYNPIFVISLLILTLFTARSAVRLVMVLATVLPITFSYLIAESVEGFRKVKDDLLKTTLGIIVLIMLLSAGYVFFSNYSSIKTASYNYVPYDYTFQWQKAMSWVRTNTPENAVFAHWWDYGYWVQTMGDRATVTDGANVIVYWNYLTGRLVLTGDNQNDALQFLYSHNATNLLIDSSDIGKYGAFSSIGSDKNYDRFSQGPATLLSDSRQTQELKDGTVRIYNTPMTDTTIATYPVEEDINIAINGTAVNLIAEKTRLAYVNIESSGDNTTISFKQPEAIFISDSKPASVPMKYLYFNNKLIDYGSGIEATAYIMPRVTQTGIDNAGAVMYISPRVMRGLLAQIYILNDPFGKFSNFQLVHSEDSMNIASIKSQGYNLNEFAYLDGRGLEGPIKIWGIRYTGSEKVNPEYVQTTFPSYIDWKF